MNIGIDIIISMKNYPATPTFHCTRGAGAESPRPRPHVLWLTCVAANNI